MLSEDAIDKLIQPFIARQERLNQEVIGIIAKRIREIGNLTPSDVYKLERLLKGGADVRKINSEISRISGLQVQEIKHIIKVVAQDAYFDVKPFYDYKFRPYIPYDKNEQLQKVIRAMEKQTIGEYQNLSKAQAFMIRDMKDPKKLIPMPLSKAYYSVIDEAVQASQQGVTSYNQSMRRTLQQLVDSGIRGVTYQAESGRIHSQRLDTAVRRNILDGIRAVNQGVQDVVGEQFGADGKEITVHANSAPDHEPIQGHQFSNEEFEKLQNEESFTDYAGNKFAPIQRAIGVLNCRHFTYSIILGVTKPNYTLQQLDQFKAKNAKGYTTKNGKHYTMYECTQVQRKYETNIRRAKETWVAAQQAGDTDLMEKQKAKISQLLKEYQSFSAGCGLKIKPQKIDVLGYK